MKIENQNPTAPADPRNEPLPGNGEPRIALSTRRWSHRHTPPRLVSFSWAAVSPMHSQR